MNQRGISSSQGSPGVTQPESHSQPSHFTLHGFLLCCSAARERNPCLLTPSSGDSPCWASQAWWRQGPICPSTEIPHTNSKLGERTVCPSGWTARLDATLTLGVSAAGATQDGHPGAFGDGDGATQDRTHSQHQCWDLQTFWDQSANLPPCSNIQQPKAATSCPSWKPQTPPTPVSSTTGNRGVRINRVLVAFYLWILGFADTPGTGMSGNMEHCQVGYRDTGMSQPAL